MTNPRPRRRADAPGRGLASTSRIGPGIELFDFVVDAWARRTLTGRDYQHEYSFVER